jgi:hypothetical protein
MTKALLAIALSATVLLSPSNGRACTAFMMADGERVLVGNNEDYWIPHTRVWFIPAEAGSYGRVFFGYDNWYPQGGMNDQGLFFDGFATNPLPVERSKGKPKFRGRFLETVMATCATVQDAVDFFERYNLEFMRTFQIFVADKSGDAAVIEGDEIIRKTGSYQVVTNFYLSKVKEDRRPCEWHRRSCLRYKKAEKMLAESDVASVALFRKILDATHQHNVFSRTLYSNIYDLKKGVVHLYYRHDFDREVVIDLKKELEKGPHCFAIPSLFGKEVKYARSTYTHCSPAFTIGYPKHFKVTDPAFDEVFRAENKFGGAPVIGVFVEEKPDGTSLQDPGKRFFTDKLNEIGTDVRLVYSKATGIENGIPANEVYFSWVSKKHWPLKTLIVSTYRGDKIVYAAVTSLAHPEALKEFLYSLRFK